MVDLLQTHPELLEAVEIVRWREAMSEKGDDYLVAFVEGSCTRPSDEAQLKAIREQAAVLVALGACAHLGGVNAIRNRQELRSVRRYVYGDKADWYETYPARPISAVVPVDAVIPGCPIDRDEFVAVVTALLQGRTPNCRTTRCASSASSRRTSASTNGHDLPGSDHPSPAATPSARPTATAVKAAAG